MIVWLLRERFPNNYGIDTTYVSVPVSVEVGAFVLTDHKACGDCHRKPGRMDRNTCDEGILKIESNGQEVTVVNFEEYISQFDGILENIRERCDYLLLDDTENHRKIVFCDLTCSDSKWVEPNTGKYSEGKRAKARKQMMASIKTLLSVPLLDHAILTFAEKICLFGWREYGVPEVPIVPQRCDVIHNMQAFMTTPSAMAGQLRQEMDIAKHGFLFIQQKYPNVYNW